MSKEARNIAYGLLYATVFLILCIVIRPHGLAANDGLSYYGGLEVTVVPYAVSFLVYAFFCWGAASSLGNRHKHAKILSASLRVMAVLLGGLVVTPHNFVDRIHTFIGAALFSFQLILSFWLVYIFVSNWKGAALLAVEFLSGVAAFYYLPKTQGLLLQSQVLYQLAFGVLLIMALNVYDDKKTVANKKS